MFAYCAILIVRLENLNLKFHYLNETGRKSLYKLEFEFGVSSYLEKQINMWLLRYTIKLNVSGFW